MARVQILPVGDRAVTVEFGNWVDEKQNARVYQLEKKVWEKKQRGIGETIPTYRSLLVYYDPTVIRYEQLCGWIRKLLEEPEEEAWQKRIVRLPVCYGARFGQDIVRIEQVTGMEREEIYALHCSKIYRIYMMGFLPGFCYLGGMDERLTVPRLSEPRLRIPAGAVGIGGSQTGIYPMESPGGWNLLGATPLPLYQPQARKSVLLEAGEYIRFVPIRIEDYYEIRREVERGSYQLEVELKTCSPEGERPQIEVVSESLPKPMQAGLAPLVCMEPEAALRNRRAAEAADPSSQTTARKHRESKADRGEKTSSRSGFRLHVLTPGALSTVQDAGRFGYQRIGVTTSGVMDRNAYALANRLVENDPQDAVIEMTVIGAAFLVEGSGVIALTGADMQPLLNDEPIEMNRAYAVKDGDFLTCQNAVNGCRTYLAISGGVDVPLVLGSRSTNLRCHMGGYEGRSLQRRDCLSAGKSLMTYRANKSAGRISYSQEIVLRYLPGPQAEQFSEEEQRKFQEAVYCVREQSDRMGCRLDGPAIHAEGGNDIISDGIVFGSIQIPADGRPIVLMADHQTTGGYAKIGTVLEAELPKLAQLMPGGRIRFQAVEGTSGKQENGRNKR